MTESQITDLYYAIKQLEPLTLNRVQGSIAVQVADRVQRAFDALDRIKEAYINDAINAELPALE